ncbi:RagB/SusD family nutrient uptake outer membrane protein [Pedobacter sp. KBS0701]|uniref:RagB/SusD family nutrient uptake outer membrane protein n=1 Tax=Pedobacter sp. KBS0701 TaxID=2578106 RepID=UPI00110E75D9|nr:RagB/SusD family nutrient uptake outer membrane protein [Pedobacter sp. KBS0701]QDW24440.1 RagB/SusD family nutrient uptake outer membrane protein [Pedobacter sp. KBS0701]
MKIKYLLLAIAVASLSACVKLDENPKSFISPEQFYKTAGDAISAVNAIYYPMVDNSTGAQPIYNRLFYTGLDFLTDDLDAGPGSPNAEVRALAKLTHASTNLRIQQIWTEHYEGINKANIALERIPAIEMDGKLKNRLLGEAKFLRAFYYFNLVRLYGDVPLLLKDQTQLSIAELQVPRTPKEQVYLQIINDLETAASLFKAGSSGEAGRATEGAAVALLSKVYLTRRDWANAVKYAEAVITGTYGYALFDDYAQVFLPAYKNGKEHIFSAQIKGSTISTGHLITSSDIRSGVPGLKGSYGNQLAFYTVGSDNFFSLYKLYSSKDKRKRVSFVTYYTSPADGKKYATINAPGDSVPFINKNWDPNYASTGNSDANMNILRFAEVILIDAEAENELNGPTGKAYTSINKIRKRACLADLTTGLTKDQFRDSVYLDRRLELVGECHRYFDLIRQTGTEVTGVGPEGKGILLKNLKLVGKTNVAARHYLYAIPQGEIDRNPKLTQNPGW